MPSISSTRCTEANATASSVYEVVQSAMKLIKSRNRKKRACASDHSSIDGEDAGGTATSWFAQSHASDGSSESSDSEDEETRRFQMTRRQQFKRANRRRRVAQARARANRDRSVSPLRIDLQDSDSSESESKSESESESEDELHRDRYQSTKPARARRARRARHARARAGRLSNSDSSDENNNASESKSNDSSVDDDDAAINIPSESEILSFGLLEVGITEQRQGRVRHCRNVEKFKSHYGVGPKTVWALYKDLKKEFPTMRLKYYLLTLNWFKSYDIEDRLSSRWDLCEDTIRVKTKECARKIQSLKPKKIVFGGWEDSEIHIITVDGVNFTTQEFRLDPHAKWFDHKSKSSGLTYEFAVAIRRNKLVWIKGPEPAGKQHDITMFRGGTKDLAKDKWDRNSLYFKLPPGKRAVGDSGYVGVPEKVTATRDQHSSAFKSFLGRAKNRQESFHTRLKSFNVLGHRFRHGKSTEDKINLHQTCVEAICVLVQYDLENGHPLFEV